MNHKIYMDHAATTAVKEEVLQEMLPYFSQIYGNPSSIYSFGRDAKRAIEVARDKVAKALGTNPSEIYFTAGGSESDNWAVKGVAYANRKKGNHIITTAIEHHAVLDTCKYLDKNGFQITYLPVDKDGLITAQQVADAITDKTILITVMYANNEIGVTQPIQEIGKIAKEKGIYFHTDAVQAIGAIPVSISDLHVDFLSLAAHKFYGPKGIGVLYIRRGVQLETFIHGGAQERNKRAGTENVPGIVGLGKAIEIAVNQLDSYSSHVQHLRDRLITEVMSKVPNVRLNGHPTKRLPGNVNFSIEYIEGESLLLSLDMKGIAASSGSACTSGSLDPSHVLLAIGLPHEIAHGSLRLTLGEENTDEDVDYCVEVIPGIVNRLREMSPLFLQTKGDFKNV